MFNVVPFNIQPYSTLPVVATEEYFYTGDINYELLLSSAYKVSPLYVTRLSEQFAVVSTKLVSFKVLPVVAESLATSITYKIQPKPPTICGLNLDFVVTYKSIPDYTTNLGLQLSVSAILQANFFTSSSVNYALAALFTANIGDTYFHSGEVGLVLGIEGSSLINFWNPSNIKQESWSSVDSLLDTWHENAGIQTVWTKEQAI